MQGKGCPRWLQERRFSLFSLPLQRFCFRDEQQLMPLAKEAVPHGKFFPAIYSGQAGLRTSYRRPETEGRHSPSMKSRVSTTDCCAGCILLLPQGASEVIPNPNHQRRHLSFPGNNPPLQGRVHGLYRKPSLLRKATHRIQNESD